ncbi:MAG: helix-turn-helix transcriptional regulator [Rikenellaceae bacterium]
MKNLHFTEYIKRIGLNIRVLRLSRNLTVQEVAYRCNIERSNLSRIEAGKTNLTIKTICQICDALDVSFEYLVTNTLNLESIKSLENKDINTKE